MWTERSHVRRMPEEEETFIICTKGKVDSKEERKEDLATVVTFEPHQMMVTTTMVQTMMSRSLNQIT